MTTRSCWTASSVFSPLGRSRAEGDWHLGPWASLALPAGLHGNCSEWRESARPFSWIARHKEFRHEYTLARELRAEDLAEEIIEIADDPCVCVEKIGADGRAEES